MSHATIEVADNNRSDEPRPYQSPACTRCRGQKLKCSKSRPACKRCVSLKKTCSYPLAPDRKKLATQRIRHRSWTPQRSHGSASPLQQNERNPLANKPENIYVRSVPSGAINESHPQSLDSGLTSTPRGDMARFLIEIYFSRVYNSSLLFHKPRFLFEWATDAVPDFVSLSMFALSSIFLHNQTERNSSSSEMFNVSSQDWRKYGTDWAKLASQKVLAQADIPAIHTSQACQILVLYWFACGQTDRANFHATVAYRTCRLLGYHRSDDTDKVDAVTVELRRRCLWSCWMTQCISQENAQFSDGSWGEISGVLLPSDDTTFIEGSPSTEEYVDSNGDLKLSGPSKQRSTRASYNAEFAKLIGLWWEAHRAVKRIQNRNSRDTALQTSSVFDLARRLERFHENLPYVLHFNNAAISASREDCESIFALNCLYHTCVASLHASLVPIFSSTVNVSDIPKNLIQASAQEALENSTAVLNMASSFLEYSPDVSKVPSITGFCMFVCISIRHSYISSKRQSRSFDDRCKSAMSILNILKGYWKPLQPLAETLERNFNRTSNSSTLLAPRSHTDARTDQSLVNGSNEECLDSVADVFTFVRKEDAKSFKQISRPAHHSGSESLLPYDPTLSSTREFYRSIECTSSPDSSRQWDEPASRQGHTTTAAHEFWWDHQSANSSSGPLDILDNPLINRFHPV